jgi:hypothetical protein
LEKRTEFFFAGKIVKWEEGRGRILLGDNTGGGTVMLRLTKLECVGV